MSFVARAAAAIFPVAVLPVAVLPVAVLPVALLSACGAPQFVPEGDLSEPRTLARRPVMLAELPPGFSLPYSLDNILSTFGDCRDGGRRQHNGVDLGGVGPDSGLGTPVYSMVRARVVAIMRPEDDPRRYGTRDRRPGKVERGGQLLPRSGEISGYGRVHFFTSSYGSSRTGVMIVTEAIDAGIEGYEIRYMHLAEVHPELRPGDEVEAGQELGLMGGTAIMEATPHVHIDLTDLRGERVDPAPFLGMERDRERCRTARDR